MNGLHQLNTQFSCAEYESPDITEYLRRVNNVSLKYPIRKFCTKDPMSDLDDTFFHHTTQNDIFNIYSQTSDNEPSEKQTNSPVLRIEITTVVILKVTV